MRVRLALLLIWMLAGTACRSSDVPASLLSVADVGPAAVELGDRLEIEGSGFPEGKPATLTFQGSLHRPGREPLDDVEITTRASSSTRSRIALLLDEELYAEFTGRGAHAEHSTFHGRLVVSVAPRQRAAPPITGVLENVVLDFAAPPGSASTTEAAAQGGRWLAFAGVSVHDAPGRLLLQNVASGSRAEAAGLLPGDEIIEFDGVRARSVADLFPSSRRRQARLLVQRSGASDPVPLILDVRGFRDTSAEELAPAAALVLLASVIFALCALPAARVLTWCERRLAARVSLWRKRRRPPPFRSPLQVMRGLRVALRARVGEPSAANAAVRIVPNLTSLAVTGLLTLIAAGRSLLMPELDLVLLLIASGTIVAVTAMVVGGFGARAWSLWSGLKRAGVVASCQLPLFAGIAAVLLATGSLRVRDVVLAQGAWPWQWHAFKNPALLLAFLVYFAALVPDAGKSQNAVRELDAGAAPEPLAKVPALAALRLFADWTLLLMAAGVGAALFLGGGQLPLLGAAGQAAEPAYLALGAALLLAKSWALVLLVLGVRWLLPVFSLGQLVRFCWQGCVPFSAAGLALAVVWSHAIRPSVLRALERGSGIVVFGLAVLLALHVLRSVAGGVRPAKAASGVNPWL
jgi:NADH-quinone oxidoreductase subunit H